MRPSSTRPADTDLAAWRLDPGTLHLNHGSFGARPSAVSAACNAFRDRLEADPVDFMARRLEPLLDEARIALATFVGADPDDLAFVDNATGGINAVLRSLALSPGDEVVITDHGYNAVGNAVDYVCSRAGALRVVARVPFPVQAPEQVVESVLACVGPRTRLVVVDHVTSPTALVLPVGSIVTEVQSRGIDVLVDGAHAPGMLALDLDALGAAWYVGNCHKWLCAPNGAGFLHARRDRQDGMHPLVVSHGYNSPRSDRSRFQIEFGWQGTRDPSPWLTVPEAIRVMESMCPGGWPGVMARNRALAIEARALLCERLGLSPPCPDAMLGSMASLTMPRVYGEASRRRLNDPLQEALYDRFGIEAPAMPWPDPSQRLLRVSAQLYNCIDDYARLADALECLGMRA